jgi:hypothetical protein
VVNVGPEDISAPPLRVSGSRSRPARRAWPLAALTLVLAVATGLGWWLAGGRTSAPLRSPGVSAAPSAPSAVVSDQAQAAAWIAGQVSAGAIIACNPGLCPVLQEQGVAPGRLMPLGAAASSPLGADVLVTSWPAGGRLAARYRPALIASFGSGPGQVEVFAVQPGGMAAYQAALRADLAARRSAGSQLVRNSHIRFTGPGAARLRAGQVDTRLLATLAVLASRYSFQVSALGDTSPGAPVLFREVVITGIGRDRSGALAMVRAQDPPYVPAHVLAVGQTGLSIEFALPSPLGLLSPVLGTGSPPPSSASAGGALSLRSNPDR